MRTWMGTLASVGCRFSKTFATLATLLFLTAATALAQPAGEAGGVGRRTEGALSGTERLVGDGLGQRKDAWFFCTPGQPEAKINPGPAHLQQNRFDP